MFLSTTQLAESTIHTSRRVSRGIGSGLDKVGGRGHKGQESRAGGFRKIGLEDGQVPLQRHLSKRDFRSLTAAANAEAHLSELNLTAVNEVDALVLEQAGLIPAAAPNIKVIASGEISKTVTLKGVKATKGTKAAVEAAGGKIGG